MKSVSSGLNNHLNNSKQFCTADLYELRLANGASYYYTSAEHNIVYDGRLYSASELIINRTQIKIMSKVAVDKMTVKIAADKSDKIAGQSFHAFAHKGGLDRAKMFLKRIFFDGETGLPIGHVSLFGGVVEVKNGGGITLELSVKAETQGLNMQFPRRHYYPQSPYGNISGKDTNTALVAPFVPSKDVLY